MKRKKESLTKDLGRMSLEKPKPEPIFAEPAEVFTAPSTKT